MIKYVINVWNAAVTGEILMEAEASLDKWLTVYESKYV